MQHKLITLENGLRVLISPMHQVESVTVMLAVAAGSRNETKEVNGLFHFIEHLAFKGNYFMLRHNKNDFLILTY